MPIEARCINNGFKECPGPDSPTPCPLYAIAKALTDANPQIFTAPNLTPRSASRQKRLGIQEVKDQGQNPNGCVLGPDPQIP